MEHFFSKLKSWHAAIISAVFGIIVIIALAMFFYSNQLFFAKSEVGAEKKEELEMIPTETLKIGFITDVHCYAKQDKKTKKWQLNWRCIEPLKAFAQDMNQNFHPDFVIENGDFVDGKDKRSYDDFIEALALFNEIESPKYHVMGNHEARSFDKATWMRLVGYEKPYYYFDIKGYRVIVLDGNNKLVANNEVINASPGNEFYPGILDKDQLQWLKGLLDHSKQYEKIVFVHQPPYATDDKLQEQLFIGGQDLRQLFAANNVRLVFSGHIERTCNFEENGVQYFLTPGFWKENSGLKDEYRYKDSGIFSQITINKKSVDVIVNHRKESEEEEEKEKKSDLELDKNPLQDYEKIQINSQNADCFSGIQLQ